MVRSLCEDLKYRVDAVDVAVKAGIHKRPQPDRLPNNIYGTDGDWETYSTPSRDARLKTAFKELRDEVARFLALAAAGSNRLAYAGNDIRGDLRHVYWTRRAPAASPTRAATAREAAGLCNGRARLYFPLSFDPHHCAERRWGAPRPSSSRPARTASTSVPGTTRSSGCATSRTAPMTCAWGSRWRS